MELRIGGQIKGYELKERIGAGGFGAVYRAYQSTVGREVAMKIILPGYANQPDFIRRFEAEAQVIARLEHLHIVPLYDYWRDPDGAYLVMRWLRGGSLYDRFKSQGRLSIEETVTMVEQLTQALHNAHRNQVVHRDIKPGNVLLDEDGNAYLADFGIAKDYGFSQGVTNPDAIVGSPDYLAPEQARSEPVTPQTDIYSLGVVLYEMLTGEHPFPNLSAVERLFKYLEEPLPAITTLDGRICDDVNAVIQKATAKDPLKRFKDALTLAQAVREAAALDSSLAVTSPVELLTPREQEVLKLMIEGKANREIAEALVIEVSTVKTYINQIYRKLNVRSRVQAIVKARELELIVGKPKTRVSTSSLPEPENPYKGLRAFQAADVQDFFGREKLTQKLVSRLQENVENRRFLAVVGPSGSGKSSVVKAGLIPALWRGDLPGSDRWYIVDMLPGSHPLEELEVALLRVADDRGLNLREHLQRDARGLLRAANLLLPDNSSQLLLVIDQFEEVFTLVEREDHRQHFLNLIRESVTDNRSRVRVVVTLRADYYDRPLQYPDFGELVRSRIETVLPLGAEELERAVREPALRVGVKFDDGLVSRIVGDVHYQPGALPLLQYALTELFERRDGRKLTQTAYTEIGGTGGALANRADEIYLEGGDEVRELVRQMFLRLVTLGEGAEDTRRRTSRAELLAVASDPDAMDEIIDLYAASRLLSLDNDPETRTPTVEVAHEAILHEWERLRQWLNTNRDDIRQERLIAQAAEAWKANNRDASYLLTGTRLAQAETWREMTELALTPLEGDFIQASVQAARTQEIAEAERQVREAVQARRSWLLLRVLVAVFAAAAVLSGGFGVFALNSRNAEAQARLDAEKSEQEALRQASIGLAALAEKELEGATPERGVLLALVALEEYPYTSQAESALARTVDEYRSYRIFEGGEHHGIQFYKATWSPDGRRVAADNVIWDADTRAVIVVHDMPVNCAVGDLAWSPSGDRLAIAGCGVGVWDTASGEALLTFPDDVRNARSINWSPDGTTLVTGHNDGTARTWDAARGTASLTLSGHTGAVNDASWAPDGTRIVTASEDGTVRLWDTEAGSEDMILDGHVGSVLSLDWSPDSTRLVTGGSDGMPRVWDVTSGTPLFVLRGHTDAVVAVDWSADGSRIASQSRDGTVKVWDTTTGGLLFQIRNVSPGEGGYVTFSPNGTEILATDVDSQFSRVFAWDTSLPTPKLFGHTADIMVGAWSPDGTVIHTSSHDGTVRLWDAATGEQLMILDNEGSADFSDWSPDGTRVVVPRAQLGEPGTPVSEWEFSYRVWNAKTGEVSLDIPLDSPEQAVVARWSPDGSRIAGTTWSPILSPARVWDAASGELLSTLQPDDTCMQGWPAWSPDSTEIVTGCLAFGESGKNTPLRVWDAATGQLLTELESEYGWTYNTAWSPDGKRLSATYEGGVVRIWDAETWEPLLTFAGHSGQVFYAAWSPDGSRIASRDLTGVVKIWDPETGQETTSFTMPGGEGSLNWSPDGTHIIATGGFTVPIIKRVWQSTNALIAYAYECCVTRELTAEERAQFGLPQQ